ncbi:MAG: hypothetical protein JSW34_07245, partial [Candidatus Zixiibacteriota bacterium]
MKRTVLDIPVAGLVPTADAVLAAQGIPAGPRPPQRTVRLVEDAIEMLTMLAAPRSVFMEITRRDFGA